MLAKIKWAVNYELTLKENVSCCSFIGSLFGIECSWMGIALSYIDEGLDGERSGIHYSLKI